jgi:hypothetical protein
LDVDNEFAEVGRAVKRAAGFLSVFEFPLRTIRRLVASSIFLHGSL